MNKLLKIFGRTILSTMTFATGGVSGMSAAKSAGNVFVENSDGTDDGVFRLINSMRSRGIEFYKTGSNPSGLIAPCDVVLLQINCQWSERGGTNTDLINAVIDAIAAHPDGFTGEIIIADNGQAQFGSEGFGGALDWKNANSKNKDQSVMDVIRASQKRGLHVTGVLWDSFTEVQVNEFDSGDFTDGFVVEDGKHESGIVITYPKFTTEYGTHVSFKRGVWNPDAKEYDSGEGILKIINMPVLKSHALYHVTGAVKGYMGTTSDKLTQTPGQDPRFGGLAHQSIGNGGMGTQMVHTRMPILNLMDMIWIGVEKGPAVGYADKADDADEDKPPSLAKMTTSPAVGVNKIAASLDPFALDVWATRNVLMVEAEKLGKPTAQMDPTGDTKGTFGYWLRLSQKEVHKAGIPATIDEADITVYISEGK